MSAEHSPIDYYSSSTATPPQFGPDADMSLSFNSLTLEKFPQSATGQGEVAYHEHYLEDYGTTAEPETPRSKGSSGSITRTVAMIKNHGLNKRLDIEHRILEAGFEIMKERQMEIDVETDPDTLFDLFGDDAASFAEGPIRVYVLERRRAVEVWLALMGEADPILARQSSPNSLRALYGLSLEKNVVMGSPDRQSAEIQIAALFASSPPFPTSELPDMSDPGTMRSTSSSLLAALRNGNDTPKGVSKGSQNLFRVIQTPASLANPTIVPRTTKAAALRAGTLKVDPGRKSVPRSPPTKQELAKTFSNVPGHKRTVTVTVASTAAPTIAPRMTRAASLRISAGKKSEATPVKKSASTGTTNGVEKSGTLDGVPGHKRRETISVASTAAPTIAPRMNKSAALRASKESSAPPSSFSFRGSGAGVSRSTSQASFNSDGSTPQGQRPRSSMGSQTNTGLSASTSSVPKPSTVSRASTVGVSRRPSIGGRPSVSASANSVTSDTTNKSDAQESISAVFSPKPKPRSSSIQPRTNRSAELRAAKMAAAAGNKAGAATTQKSRAVWA